MDSKRSDLRSSLQYALATLTAMGNRMSSYKESIRAKQVTYCMATRQAQFFQAVQF